MTIVLERVTRINGLDNKHPHLVLDDVSITFPEGRSIGILGTRGSGKSTLIKVLAGALRPTSGTVKRHRQVSFPVGSFGWMNRFMTGRENLRFLARLYGVSAAPVIDFVAEVSGIGAALDQYVGAYSGEKRSRLAFATSYAVPFDTYLADEFLVGGPPDFRNICKDLVRQRQKHSTFILATRSPALVRMYCDVGAILHDGKIQLYDSVQDAVMEYSALLAMQSTNISREGLATEMPPEGFWNEAQLADAS